MAETNLVKNWRIKEEEEIETLTRLNCQTRLGLIIKKKKFGNNLPGEVGEWLKPISSRIGTLKKENEFVSLTRLDCQTRLGLIIKKKI